MKSLDQKTIQNLEQCCADLFALYWRAMAAAKPVEEKGRKLRAAEARARTPMFQHKVFGAAKPSAEQEAMATALREDLERYERDRAKFRAKANLYRRQAETILAVLQWAAPNKERDRMLKEGTLNGADSSNWPANQLRAIAGIARR
jgi:hypothetical protein